MDWITRGVFWEIWSNDIWPLIAIQITEWIRNLLIPSKKIHLIIVEQKMWKHKGSIKTSVWKFIFKSTQSFERYWNTAFQKTKIDLLRFGFVCWAYEYCDSAKWIELRLQLSQIFTRKSKVSGRIIFWYGRVSSLQQPKFLTCACKLQTWWPDEMSSDFKRKRDYCYLLIY